MTMQIDVLKLKSSIDLIFQHIIEKRGVRQVELGSDLYWNVPEDALYNMVEQPQEMDIGRLSDDWELVSKVLDEGASPLAYQLTEIAPLLRRLGEVLGRDLASRGG